MCGFQEGDNESGDAAPQKVCAGRSGSGLAAWWPEVKQEQRKGQSTRREGEAKGFVKAKR